LRPRAQAVGKSIDALLVGVTVEGNVAHPVVRPCDDRLMEPVMPEAPVDHVRKELGNLHKRGNNDRLIELIHPPFVFKDCEDSVK
jgi:hypothetical protein